ncbi:MAG TPA: hypothetical protein VKZ49_11190 [Polyangiaceae bacterium]|nr:hypothetical protein [Polyangiaceae bacterium]
MKSSSACRSPTHSSSAPDPPELDDPPPAELAPAVLDDPPPVELAPAVLDDPPPVELAPAVLDDPPPVLDPPAVELPASARSPPIGTFSALQPPPSAPSSNGVITTLAIQSARIGLVFVISLLQ